MTQTALPVSTARKWTIFLIVSISSFMALLSATSVSLALPIMEKEFSTSLSGIQWVVTSYLLTISSILPIFGWAGDMTQRKYVIAAGFAVFGLGGVLCAQSVSLQQLIFFRLVQGIGASMFMANSYAAVTAVFPISQRGRALGMQGSIVALGNISGPPVGGFVLEFFHWHVIFYATLPFAILGVILTLIYMPKTHPHKIDKFDFPGAVMLIVAIASLIICLSQWRRPGWSDSEILFYGISALAFFTALYKWEKHTPAPILDINMFKNKVFFFGNLAGLCSFLALNANSMLLPFYLHKIIDVPPRIMGMVMIVFPIALIITAPISGALSDRYGASIFAITGMVAMCVSLIFQAFIAPMAHLPLLVIALAVFGASNGMFQSPNNSTTLSVVPPEKHGMAGSIIALMRNFGAVTGTAVAVRVCDMVSDFYIAGRFPEPGLENAAFLAGYQAALIVGAFFALLAMLMSFNKKKNLQAQP